MIGYFSVLLYHILKFSNYIRYYADDYCTAGKLFEKGFWGAQKFWYLNWQGRYSYNFFIHLLEAFGVGFVRVTPYILAASFISAYFVLFYLLLKYLFKKAKFLEPLLLSLASLVIILITTPSIIQSFYWQTGALTYFIPLIFFGFAFDIYLYSLINHNKHYFLNSLLFIIVFIMGGFSESFLVFSIGIFSAITLYQLIINKVDKSFWTVLTATVSSFISMGFVYFAPGNSVRMSMVPKPEFMKALILSIKGAKQVAQAYFQPVSLLSFGFLFIIIIYVYCLNKERGKPFKKYLLPYILFTLTSLMGILIFLPAYSLSTIPPARTFIFIGFILALIALTLSFFIAANIFKWTGLIALLKVLLIIASFFFYSLAVYKINLMGNMVKDYSKKWDTQSQIIETKILEGSVDIKTTSTGMLNGLDRFTPWPNSWVNVCGESYYRINRLWTE